MNKSFKAGQVTSVACSPRSFLKGLWLLTKGFIKDMAPVGAVVGVVLLFFEVKHAFSAGHLDASLPVFAVASIIAFLCSAGCAFLAYLIEPRRGELMLAGLLSFMVHMMLAMLTWSFVPAEIAQSSAWWSRAPLLVKAATLPTFGAMLLVQLVLALGVITLVVMALYNLPRAAKTATRHICKTGQGR